MHKRINISLPEQTVRLLDRVAPSGDRSRLIDQAVRYYVQALGRSNVRKQLAEGAQRNAGLDLEIAAERFGLDEETWQENDP